MNKYENLFLCKSLKKRGYQYRGGPFHTSWKLKDRTTNKLYDSYEDYEAEQVAVAKKDAFKKNMAAGKKKAAEKKVVEQKED